MTEVQKDLNKETPINLTGTYKHDYFTKSVVSYLSGIHRFDALLNGRKFAETKYQFQIGDYGNFISFTLVLMGKVVSAFNIPKDEIKDISLSRNRAVEFDTLGHKEGRLGALTMLSPLVGFVTTVIDGLTNAAKDDKLYVKSIVYPNGAIYEMHIKDLEQSKIVFTTVEGNFLEAVDIFLLKAFDFNFSGKIGVV